MRLASRLPSLRVLAIAVALAGASLAPAFAQDADDEERSGPQRGRVAARAALEAQRNDEADRPRPTSQAQQRGDMRRDHVQRRPQARPPAAESDASRQQMHATTEQRERARQAQLRQSQMRQRGDERERQRSADSEVQRSRQRDLALRQQRGIAEREAAQRRQRDRVQEREPRPQIGPQRAPLVVDEGRRQALRGSDDRRDNDARQRLGREQQERRIAEERRRSQRYHRQRDGYERIAQQRARALQQQRRMAQYRYQQQYYQRLRLQQARWDSRRHDYNSDPYYYTPASHRFSYGGRWHQTNRYGAELMRQAVDYGYREGVRAAQADRRDQWRNDYRNSYAYQDASYGYNGHYVGHDVYSHYFRQGFERGYQDAYSDRYRYGRRNSDGEFGVIAAVVTAILGLQLLH